MFTAIGRYYHTDIGALPGFIVKRSYKFHIAGMKTRIVYPQLWLDEKFAACSVATKLLFCYLINNIQLGLSRYLHITDRQIMFDTGLNANQLETGKKELTNLRWCFFAPNWVYHNHKCAYIDYEGRDRVIQSKDEEIGKVPTEIKDLFKGLVTGYQPVLNHKSEIINHKSETKIQGVVKRDFSSITDLTEPILQEIADKYSVPLAFVHSKLDDMTNWQKSKGKTYKDYKAALCNWVKTDAIKLVQKQHQTITKLSVTQV